MEGLLVSGIVHVKFRKSEPWEIIAIFTMLKRLKDVGVMEGTQTLNVLLSRY